MTAIATLPRPDDIDLAAERISRLVRTTPATSIDGAELGVEGTVSLKLEMMQHSGSFKARGASNFMLSNTIGDAGVVAASGGNHGAAVAWAAQELGHKAAVFVPTISAPAKVERLRSYGAEVHQVGAVYADALAASKDYEAESNATPIHAYEDPVVVAGAGTCGREFADQVGAIDVMLIACGGGGLAGGAAAWFGQGSTKVIACETEGTAAYAAALDAGRPVDVEIDGLAADALGASRIGELGWSLMTAANAESIVVTDDEVIEAGRFLWERFRVLAEASAVVPLAAVLSGRFVPKANQHVGIIICGANTTL